MNRPDKASHQYLVRGYERTTWDRALDEVPDQNLNELVWSWLDYVYSR